MLKNARKNAEDFLLINQDKCVGCTACARICPTRTISGAVKEKHQILYDNCVVCGQCIGACPVGAIEEKMPHIEVVLKAIQDPKKTVIIQTAPSVRATIGEGFGQSGQNIQKKLVSGLRKLGFDYVFDTSLGADFTIMEEANELLERLKHVKEGKKGSRLPILTSCCPAWVNFFEREYPDLLDIPSSAKSPMQMLSALTKTYFAQKMGIAAEDMIMVSLMPCLSKKYEASRPEFSVDGIHHDTDYVISSRDMVNLFQSYDIHLPDLEDGAYDNEIFGDPTGAGVIFGRTAGVLEAALRTAYEWKTNKTLEQVEFKEIRGVVGLRVAEIDFDGVKLKVAVTNGFDDARVVLNQVRAGSAAYDAMEIMACQGGCIGGGLNPKVKGPKEACLIQRAGVLDEEDTHSKLRKSHENPYVLQTYADFLGGVGTHLAHELLHTEYFPKSDLTQNENH